MKKSPKLSHCEIWVYLALNIKHNYTLQGLHSNCSVTFLGCGMTSDQLYLNVYYERGGKKKRSKIKLFFAVIKQIVICLRNKKIRDYVNTWKFQVKHAKLRTSFTKYIHVKTLDIFSFFVFKS